MGRIASITRRAFLLGASVVAGGVVFGYWQYRRPYDNPLKDGLGEGELALTPYIRIDQSGVTIITPRAEMGQGVHTTLAALVAEELDVAWDAIRVEHGPASKAYYNGAILEEGAGFAPTDTSPMAERMRAFMHVPAKFMGFQITGGSSSVADAYQKMRVAGAAAREVMLEAAARKLDVSKASLKTEDGHVIAADGARLSYVNLAPLAGDIEPPANPKLKPRSKWRYLGKSMPRVDMVGKSTGTATFAIDVRLPDMLHATVKMNPGLGGSLTSFDDTAARAMPGVKKIVPLDGGVAVVATNTWYAFQAAEAIRFDWGAAPYPADTEGHFAAVAAAFEGDHDSRMRDDGDVEEALASGDVISAEYRVPYLAHATMEPLNAAALLKDGKLQVWAGNQAPTQVVVEAQNITGLEEKDITVHTMLMGGGFGRRAEMDFIKHAIHVAKAMEGTLVSVTWSREEDMTHDGYRPLGIGRFRAKVENGVPSALDIAVSCPSVIESQMGRLDINIPGPDATIVQATWDQPYDIPNYRSTGYRAKALLPVSSWRSVGASQNGFYHESAMDEIAHAAGVDPLEMRLKLISHGPSRKVLEAVAEMSGWGNTLPAGHGRGIAFVMAFGVPVAEVIEVAYTDGAIRILKAFAAVDVGLALDPRNVEAQVQSGINFGLSAAMTGEITVADGRVEQTNFDTYDGIRIHQAPEIMVRIMENGDRIRGIGEPGTPPAAPALANAIFAATGQRIRELPLSKHIDFA